MADTFSFYGQTWGAGDLDAFIKALNAHGVDYTTWAENHPDAAAILTGPQQGAQQEAVPKSVGEALGAYLSAGATPEEAAAAVAPLAQAQVDQGFGAPTGPELVQAAQDVQAAQQAAAPPPEEQPTPQPSPTPPQAGPPTPPALVNTAPLNGLPFITAMFEQAGLHDIDPLAAAAVALQEGAGGGIGDQGTAYGPWQIHLTDGRLAEFDGRAPNSADVQAWAWSEAGIKEAFDEMVAGGAKGLTRHDSVHAIVYGFEKPANEPKEQADAGAEYDVLYNYPGDVHILLAPKFVGVGGAIAGTGLGGTSQVEVAQPAATVQSVKPAGVNTAWHDLVEGFHQGAPATSGKVKSLAADLVKVFQ